MTFFARFEADILAGKKTITIRDKAESYYVPESIVTVSTLEQGREFCQLQIDSVEAIQFCDLSEFHAQQENMTLTELKNVIRDIYPDLDALYVIHYHLIRSLA
ncbi:ASCH domain-containing protein [Vibrio sp. S11_S32]|uniref:N(4)-acetylcytidine amidohydrolase n=2 Tax=Vibrionaceae TaxID=641 RepID=A0A5Q0TGR9_9VIBR|nr:ASCH domain-containing protein [Vibrio sp. S11_S32]